MNEHILHNSFLSGYVLEWTRVVKNFINILLKFQTFALF
jgi:hypothetical protein